MTEASDNKQASKSKWRHIRVALLCLLVLGVCGGVYHGTDRTISKRLSRDILVLIEIGEAEGVEWAVRWNPECANAVFEHGDTPLHDAAYRGYADVVKLLLAAGADVNAKDSFGDTPLHAAAINGQADVVKLLLAAGADVNAKGWIGYTPLHHAAYDGHADVAKLLLAAGADVNARNTVGDTPLDAAAKLDEDIDLKKQKACAAILREHGGKTGKELSAEEAEKQ